MSQIEKNVGNTVQTLKILIKLTRPEWGFIFAAVAGMVGLLYHLPWESIFVGWLSIYFFIGGHFSLNGYFDRKSDASNPRGLTLRNPLTESVIISKEILFWWVAFIWPRGRLNIRFSFIGGYFFVQSFPVGRRSVNGFIRI